MLLSPRVESAEASDLEMLAALRTEQGWQRSDLLLGMVQRWEHGRIFIVRAESVEPSAPDPRAIIASTSGIVAGAVGVIGTVIVSSDYRRRGLGRLVMQSCLEWMRAQGARTVMLDATNDGRPLYFDLGFVAVEQSYWGHGLAATMKQEADTKRDTRFTSSLRAPSDLTRVAELDRAAFGGDRLGLLSQLLSAEATWLYISTDEANQPVGYTIARCLDAPYVGIRLGPWVATSDEAATALLAAVLSDDAPWHHGMRPDDEAECELFASMPGGNKHALRLFKALGGTLEEDDLVMRLDLAATYDASSERRMRDDDQPRPAQHLPPIAEHPQWLYGWIAPMVF